MLLQDQRSTLVFTFLPYPLRCGLPSQVCSLFWCQGCPYSVLLSQLSTHLSTLLSFMHCFRIVEGEWNKFVTIGSMFNGRMCLRTCFFFFFISQSLLFLLSLPPLCLSTFHHLSLPLSTLILPFSPPPLLLYITSTSPSYLQQWLLHFQQCVCLSGVYLHWPCTVCLLLLWDCGGDLDPPHQADGSLHTAH